MSHTLRPVSVPVSEPPVQEPKTSTPVALATRSPSTAGGMPSPEPSLLMSVPTLSPTRGPGAQSPLIAPSMVPSTMTATAAPTSAGPSTMTATAAPTSAAGPSTMTATPTSARGGGMPSISPAAPGTDIPSGPGVVTATRFDVEYMAGDVTVTEDDMNAAAEVTVDYIVSFMQQQFGFSQGNQVLDDVVVTIVDTDAATLQATYDVTLKFGMDSIAFPTQEDVDNLLFTAFSIPFVTGLLTLLAENLPESNPLSSTSSAVYTPNRRRMTRT